jgi:hypothetical protein
MKILKIGSIILLLTTLMACSLTVNVPEVRTGVTQTLAVNEAYPSEPTSVAVNIEMGAGTLKLSSGAASLMQGTIEYNVDTWKPVITREGTSVTISQKNTTNVGIPNGQIKNIWDLKLGSAPMELSISTGAYEGALDLSGLSITNLSITDGASKSSIGFDSLNPVEMNLLQYKTGASEVDINGLGNANVNEVTFDGGVGSYGLDFSGDLKKDMNVRINSGMSDLTLTIPVNVRSNITINGGLSNINANGTWTIAGSTYQSGTTGPMINININMAVGNLTLIQK